MDNHTSSLSPKILAGIEEFKRPFIEQYESARDTLISCTTEYPIALCAVFGSILKGLSRRSDIDILVLLRDDYHSYGNILDIKEELEERIAANAVNKVPVDLQVRSVSSFFDLSRGLEFKRSVEKDNEVFWEDGVTIGREHFSEI